MGIPAILTGAAALMLLANCGGNQGPSRESEAPAPVPVQPETSPAKTTIEEQYRSLWRHVDDSMKGPRQTLLSQKYATQAEAMLAQFDVDEKVEGFVGDALVAPRLDQNALAKFAAEKPRLAKSIMDHELEQTRNTFKTAGLHMEKLPPGNWEAADRR